MIVWKTLADIALTGSKVPEIAANYCWVWSADCCTMQKAGR